MAHGRLHSGLAGFLLLATGCDARAPAKKRVPRPAAAKEAAKPAATNPGGDLVALDCNACHGELLIEQQHLVGKQWDAVVKKMKDWGAEFEPQHAGTIASFLAERGGAGAPPFHPTTITADAAEAALAPLADGAYAGGDARHGAEVYRVQCATCHGEDGRGAAKGVGLVDRPLLYRAPEFAAVLRESRGRMPSSPAGERDVASLLAYLRTLR